MNWIRLHTGIHRNPKIKRAGRNAREVYVLLLCINGEHDFDGMIPADYASAEYLADYLGMTFEETCNAIETARNAHLFHVDEAGNVEIVGFSEEWKPKVSSSTERVRAHRERLKKSTALTANHDEGNAPRETHGTHETLHETRNEEERRGDKKRSDNPEVGLDGSDETHVTLAIPTPSKPRFDFDAVYREYPRKEGKSRGLSMCSKQIKSEGDYQALLLAVRNYAAANASNDRQYLKHFDTFMGCWKDYLEPTATVRPPERAWLAGLDRTGRTS